MVPAKAFISPSSSSARSDAPRSPRSFEFDLDRSRDCRRRHRVLSSARRVTALFHHDIEDRQTILH